MSPENPKPPWQWQHERSLVGKAHLGAMSPFEILPQLTPIFEGPPSKSGQNPNQNKSPHLFSRKPLQPTYYSWGFLEPSNPF